MKKIIAAAALLLVIGTTYATPTSKHSEERNIVSSALPAALQAKIKNDYADYWITALVQVGNDKHAHYFLTVENADQIIHLRADKSSDWTVVDTSVKPD